MRSQLAREETNRRMLDDAGFFMSAPLAIMAATFDLPTLIPAWRLAQRLRLASPVLTTGLQTGIAATVVSLR